MADTDTTGTEIATIEQTMRERPAEYFRDEGMQGRYRVLVEARGAGGAVKPAEARGRIAEIEAVMRADPARYWKSEELQSEYRALLLQTHPEPAEAEPAKPADASSAKRDAALAAAGGPEAVLGVKLGPAELAQAGGKIEVVLSNLTPAVARELEGRFRGLSDTCRAAITAELARPESGFCKPATPEEIADMRRLPGMKELLAHWGTSAAPRKLGIAMEAYDRLRGSLSAADRPEFLAFFRGATAREKQLFMWTLGGT